MGARIGFVIVIIILIGAFIYLYQSGSFNNAGGKVSLSWQSLLPHFATSTFRVGTSTYVPSATPIGSTSIGSAPAPGAPSVSPYDIPKGFTASQLSPIFHQIRLGNVSPGSMYSYGQISLYTNLTSQSSTIDVTGWQIKTNRGGEYLPQAVAVYDPSGLAAPSDILLQSGDMLNIYSNSAPVNLRINKCIGYLPVKTQFNPQLPQNCPYTDRSVVQSFSGACQNYVLSLGGCQTPNFNDPRIPQNDYNCIDYLQHNFTYKTCFDAHRADADFLSREIRVWMGSSPLDQFHDNVYLFDRNGLLVDTYSY